MTKENIVFGIIITAFVLYMTWHLGRFYGQTENQKQCECNPTPQQMVEAR